MDELQAGIEMSLAVLPQAPVLVQPGKTPLHNPALGDDRKLVKLAALGNLHRHLLCQGFIDRLRKVLAHIATVSEHALHPVQVGLATPLCGPSPQPSSRRRRAAGLVYLLLCGA